MLKRVIEDGSALKKLAEFVEAQGGDANAVYDTSKLPQASIVEAVKAPESGYIAKIACAEVGICSLILGGGRETKESEIDLAVGIVLTKKVGDEVVKGETIAYIHANNRMKLENAKERFLKAYTFSKEKPAESGMIKCIIRE